MKIVSWNVCGVGWSGEEEGGSGIGEGEKAFYYVYSGN